MPSQPFSIKTQDGIDLYAQEWRPASLVRGVIVLIHGLGEHCNRYAHLADWLNDRAYTVLALDLRGHGKSPGKRGHIPGYSTAASDINLLVEEARKRYPKLPVFVYGHSLGGALVLYYALTSKPSVNGIIATSPGLVPAAPPTGITMFIAKTASRLAPAMTIKNGLDLSGLARDPSVAEKYVADPLVHGLISSQLGMDLISQGQWIIDHAAQFPLPLLLMVGTGDRLVNPAAVQEFSKHVPVEKLTYYEWKGYYHELHNEPEKELVFEKIYLWLEKHK